MPIEITFRSERIQSYKFYDRIKCTLDINDSFHIISTGDWTINYGIDSFPPEYWFDLLRGLISSSNGTIYVEEIEWDISPEQKITDEDAHAIRSFLRLDDDADDTEYNIYSGAHSDGLENIIKMLHILPKYVTDRVVTVEVETNLLDMNIKDCTNKRSNTIGRAIESYLYKCERILKDLFKDYKPFIKICVTDMDLLDGTGYGVYVKEHIDTCRINVLRYEISEDCLNSIIKKLDEVRNDPDYDFIIGYTVCRH